MHSPRRRSLVVPHQLWHNNSGRQLDPKDESKLTMVDTGHMGEAFQAI